MVEAVRRRRLASVRSRTTVIATVTLFFGLAAAALAFAVFQHRQVIDRVDADLAIQARAIVSFAEVGKGAENLGQPLPPLPPGPGDDLWQILDPAGNVLASSVRTESDTALVDIDDPRDMPQHLTASPADVGSIRVRIESLAGGETLVVAASLTRVNEADATLRWSLLAGVPLLSLALGGVVWLVVGRALHPVDEIRRTVDEITGTELHRRVPEPGTGDEVAQMAATMNSMLARLEEAVERQRRFVGDASHELRSPLAGIRGLLEVDEYGSWESTRREALGEVVRMQSLIDNLLTMARLDAATTVSPHHAVDLDTIVLDEVQRVRPTTGIELNASAVSGAQVTGDATQLAQVVANLVSNAVRHATSRVIVSLREAGSVAVLEIVDDGTGVPAGEEAVIFERFARLDAGRSRDHGGAGLGLAICKTLVEAHTGTICVEQAVPAGTRFIVELPLSVD